MAFLSQCADLYVHLHTVIAQTQRLKLKAEAVPGPQVSWCP